MQAFYSIHGGSDARMRAQRVSPEEQYRLVMECRSSGMTDYQWCMDHQIKPGTFYNWIRRLRAKGNAVPDADRAAHTSSKQEVVRVDLSRPAVTAIDYPQAAADFCSQPVQSQPIMASPAMEVALAGAVLRIPNGTDTELLERVIRILRVSSC